jgi:hypothetical protein
LEYLAVGSLSGNHIAMPADEGLDSASPPKAPAHARLIRAALIETETILRLMGLAFVGWGALLAAVRIRNFDQQLAAFEQSPGTWLGGITGQMALPVGVGLGLCFLLPSARIGSNIFSVFLTFTVHLGLAPALVVLRIINSRKARKVLKADYKAIRQATPEQNFGFWIAPFAVGVLALLGVLFAVDSARMLG